MDNVADSRKWRFYDFTPESGRNEIRAWSTAQGAKFKARLNALIRHLETLDRVFTRQDSVGILRKAGPCHGEGLIELTITVNRIEYRPIGWYGPDARTVTLLAGAIEKGNDFVPRGACVTAVNRKRLVMMSRRHIVEHDFQ
jgi:hypothetical protein